MLARSMARELAPAGIRVNVVAPGIVHAGMAKRQLETDPAYARRVGVVIPLGELGTARADRAGDRVSVLGRVELHDRLGAAGRRRLLALPVRRAARVKIIAIDTVQVAEFPSLVFVRVHTDDGLVGLGETFFHADAVVAHVHGGIAPYLLGKDPHHRERHARDLRPTSAARSSGAEMRAASAIDIALWDVCGQAAGQPLHQLLGGASPRRDPHLQHLRRLPLRAGRRTTRPSTTGACRARRQAEGPYEDLDAFLHRADDLARDLLSRGHHGDEDLAVRPLRRAPAGGHHISSGELEAGARAVPQDPRGGRHADGRHDRAARPVGRAERRAGSPARSSRSTPFWFEDPVRVDERRRAGRGAGDHRDARRRRRDAREPAGVSRPARRGRRARRDPRHRLGAAGSPRRARSPRWPRRSSGRSRRTTAPGRWSTRPARTCRCTLPNAILQEHVRAFATGWYPSS